MRWDSRSVLGGLGILDLENEQFLFISAQNACKDCKFSPLELSVGGLMAGHALMGKESKKERLEARLSPENKRSHLQYKFEPLPLAAARPPPDTPPECDTFSAD